MSNVFLNLPNETRFMNLENKTLRFLFPILIKQPDSCEAFFEVVNVRSKINKNERIVLLVFRNNVFKILK